MNGGLACVLLVGVFIDIQDEKEYAFSIPTSITYKTKIIFVWYCKKVCLENAIFLFLICML